MTALRKTGQRLALLQGVADGAVSRSFSLSLSRTGRGDYDKWDHGPRSNIYSGHSNRFQRVTARVKELRDHELVELAPKTERWSCPYRLTAAGEALLREWGGTP